MQETVSQSTLSKRARFESAMYSMAETAALCNVGYTTLNEAVKTGSFPVMPVKIGRRYLFPKAAVHKILGLEPPALTEMDRT